MPTARLPPQPRETARPRHATLRGRDSAPEEILGQGFSFSQSTSETKCIAAVFEHSKDKPIKACARCDIFSQRLH